MQPHPGRFCCDEKSKSSNSVFVVKIALPPGLNAAIAISKSNSFVKNILTSHSDLFFQQNNKKSLVILQIFVFGFGVFFVMLNHEYK